MKLLMNCICLVSFIRPTSPSALATDIGTLIKRGPSTFQHWRAFHGYKLPQTGFRETSSLEADVASGAVSHAFWHWTCKSKSRGFGFGLLALFCVLGTRYRICPSNQYWLRPYYVPGEVLPYTVEDKPATDPVLLDLRVSGEVRQQTVHRSR